MSYNRIKKVYEGYLYLVANKHGVNLYVGQTTTTIAERWKQHIHAVIRKNTTVFDRFLKQCDLSQIEVKMLCKYSSPDYNELKKILDRNERHMIKKYNTLLPCYGGNGYNVDAGGQSNNVFGIPIDVYDMEGNLINTYPSQTDLSKKYGINVKQIYDVCHGVQKNYKCLCVFRIHGEPFDKYDIKSKFYKEIYQFTLEGDFVNKYYSADQVYEKYGITFVGEILDNPYRIAGGYWWGSSFEFKYLGEEKKPTRKIYQYNLFGKLLFSYSSTSQASKETGFVPNAIKNNCMGKTVTLHQYIFRDNNSDINDFILNNKEEIVNKILLYEYPVVRYTKNGDFDNRYENIYKASNDISVNSIVTEILNCCLHKRSSSNGYIWRFEFEPLDFEMYKYESYKNQYKLTPIDVYTLNGEYVKTIRNREEYVDFFGVDPGGSMLRYGKTYHGYIVKKQGDEKPEELDDWRVPIDKYDLNGNLLGEFNTIYDGARSLGKTKAACGSIRQSVYGKTHQSYGYVWRLHGHPFDEYPLDKQFKYREVICYSKDGEYIQTFSSVTDASIFAKRSDASVIQCCKHFSKSCGGYVFYYADDPNLPTPISTT